MITIICTAASLTAVFGLAIWLGRFSAKYDFTRECYSRMEVLEENIKELEFELEEIRNEKRKE